MTQRERARHVLESHGTTWAEEAGTTLEDTPAPLFQLVCLTQLFSAPIGASVAVATMRELLDAGWTTPRHLLDSTWQERVDALGRGGYRRYDESTATRLRKMAHRVTAEYRGDLRELAQRSDHDAGAAARLLEEFDGIGPVGAEIFLREVQDTWTWLRPHLDDRALDGAEALHLPRDRGGLGALAGTRGMAPLAAALVRVTIDSQLRDELSGSGER